MTADIRPDPAIIGKQRDHWTETFAANPAMYGTAPSKPAVAAAERFTAERVRHVLELGAGQGRDTVFLAHAGFEVVALDYARGCSETITARAASAGVADRVQALRHDVRVPLPLESARFDAAYSHMLFCMALTTEELEHLAAEVHRVVRPGGLVVYTARHTGDVHFGTGIPRGDGMFENGGFIVHFFDRALVDRLARGYEILEVAEFTEGDLPRRLWGVTMRRAAIPAG